MNDSELRREVENKVSKWFGEPVMAVEDEIMQLFTQTLTARLDAVAGALPEKPYPPIKGTKIGKKYAQDGFNQAVAACHAAIDTVRRGL